MHGGSSVAAVMRAQLQGGPAWYIKTEDFIYPCPFHGQNLLVIILALVRKRNCLYSQNAQEIFFREPFLG